ncbi:hypothetical protein [Terrisporobacter othiniensis]|nr:hypothetical protein [Terrisporobacter othiniensis]
MEENKILVECILSEKEHKEAQRIGESILAYIKLETILVMQ